MLYSEGVNFTHEEWAFVGRFLPIFPIRLSEYLLDLKNVNSIEPVLVDFIVCLLANHPLSGYIRVCNKLLPLLHNSSSEYHDIITKEAKQLDKRINEKRDALYHTIQQQSPINELQQQVDGIIAKFNLSSNVGVLSQISLTNIPPWYDYPPEEIQNIVLQLLMGSTSLVTLEHLYNMIQQTIRKIKPGPSQQLIIDQLTKINEDECINYKVCVFEGIFWQRGCWWHLYVDYELVF